MPHFENGDRVIVSFSAGKDSTVILELCRIAAEATGRLPLEVVMRDEEIMLPGTYEYAERIAGQPDIKFDWIYANQPVINVWNRAEPFFFVFDPLLEPEKWVRQPPPFAIKIDEYAIDRMVTDERYPPAEGKELICVMGLRTEESRNREYGLFSSGGPLTGKSSRGVRNLRPIYDWRTADVWKLIADGKHDYNHAYDVLHRMQVPGRKMRIAPPTLNLFGAVELKIAHQVWPTWFDKVTERCPGVRSAAYYGRRVVTIDRRTEEDWKEAVIRQCVTDAPAWIGARVGPYIDGMVTRHARHSTAPFPQTKPCPQCDASLGSWRSLGRALFDGDPFGIKTVMSYMEPEDWRPGAGKWYGKPTWG